MELTSNNTIAEILEKHKAELLADWLKELQNSGLRRDDLMRAKELRSECQEFLQLLQIALQQGNFSDIQTPEWENMRLLLAEVSRSRVQRGFTPSEIASFILCFKKPLFDRLCHELTQNRDALVEKLWLSTSLLDQLGLWVTEIFLKAREEVIERQQQEMLELSTPVVKLWQGILALPMIGTLDSARTQIVMETLLQEIMETGSEFAILDITGVPTVDTLVAQHLLKTVAAARLMGTECIISGIRPQIAQTIVHLGVDLQDILTKATLADAFKVALQRQGLTIKSLNEEK
ncbi:STAS domain-containing protein [Microcoleus sp. LEGE 07076]|uniref:STAS domain-containing protein n=1 Tax=Microcoleus sp. LEGE 07076 TaxID=915322 RepID=UPI00187F2699|nr:STAS domain-containing protein [Microcoleus sp. LEGE 07076]MBE9188328.1 STAS domain-containing protein [Microcoleus sp. LEGE 07076]